MRVKFYVVVLSFFILLSGFSVNLWSANWNPLSDSGLTKCYNATTEITCPAPGEPFYGQDGNYTQPALAFQNNGDGTVSDLNTGLMWEKSAVTPYTWQGAHDKCDGLALGGYTDWRMPELHELKSTVVYFRNNPAIDPIFDSENGAYWTASTLSSDTSQVWFISYVYGTNYLGSNTGTTWVRCVRGEYSSMGPYSDNGNGTIIDHATGLTWPKNDNGNTYTWEEALSYCENLNMAGLSNWHLPDQRELQSLIDPSRHEPSIHPIFNLMTTEFEYYYSSTTDSGFPQQINIVRFFNGKEYVGGKTDHRHVACVHNGYELSVVLDGTGKGSVSFSMPGNQCTTDCNYSYSPGTTVSLVAVPDQNSAFVGWSGGGCKGTGVCEVTITQATTVNAVFEIDAVPLSALNLLLLGDNP